MEGVKPEVREVEVGKLNPALYNPRKDLKPKDVEYQRIKKSIQEFGYVEPIVWNEQTGNIVGGHQRFKVLKNLGYEKILCMVVNMDLKKEKQLNVALNKIQGSWDDELLANLLAEFDADGVNFDFVGFTDREAHKLIDEELAEEEEPEIEFTEELLEEHNYVVLYFDNEVDWLQAETLFDLKPVQSLDSKPGFQKIGVGRVLNGPQALQKILEARKG